MSVQSPKALAVSCMAVAVHRIAIEAERHRFSALVGTVVDVLSVFMALLSFVESVPRA
jgi:hypothetical protein